MNNYYPNNRVRVSNVLTDSGGTRVNASSIYAAYFLGPTLVTSINPSSIIVSSIGHYYFDIDVVTPGEHIIRWKTYGTHFSESYDSFQVNSVMFP